MLNSHYSRGMIVIVQVGGVQNICSSTGGVQENEKVDETQNWWKN